MNLTNYIKDTTTPHSTAFSSLHTHTHTHTHTHSHTHTHTLTHTHTHTHTHTLTHCSRIGYCFVTVLCKSRMYMQDSDEVKVHAAIFVD